VQKRTSFFFFTQNTLYAKMFSEGEEVLYIKSEYKRIIEDVVKRNKNFQGNEDILDEFCEAIYKKTYLILSTKENEDDLREYLRVVSHKIMLDVIKKYTTRAISQNTQYVQKDYKQFLQDKSDYKAIKEEESDDNNQDSAYFDYASITDPSLYVRKTNKRSHMHKLVATVYNIHLQMPEKLYFQIFYYKYCKELNQTQVAKKTGLSQGELSKRLLELTQILKTFRINFD